MPSHILRHGASAFIVPNVKLSTRLENARPSPFRRFIIDSRDLYESDSIICCGDTGFSAHVPPARAQNVRSDHATVWGPMFQSQVKKCWKVPKDRSESSNIEVLPIEFTMEVLRAGLCGLETHFLNGAEPRTQVRTYRYPSIFIHIDSTNHSIPLSTTAACVIAGNLTDNQADCTGRGRQLRRPLFFRITERE
jgi:hypothetical protein